MDDITTQELAAYQRRCRRRRWRRLLLALLLLGAIVSGYRYAAAVTARDLAEAIAEADRLDPGWRLDDLEGAPPARRPDDENAYQVMLAANKALLNWEPTKLSDAFRNHNADLPLDETQRDLLRKHLARQAKALETARRLSDLRHGAHRLSDDQTGGQIPQQGRAIVRLLGYDALLRASDGDADGALASNRAAINASRTIGDVSNVLGFLVRIAAREHARDGIEATLAQSTPSEKSLAAIQEVLEIEERLPLMLNCFRGERAFLHRVFTDVESGQKPLSRHACFQASAPDFEWPPVADAYDALGTPMVEHVHAWLLHYWSELIEMAKLPPAQRGPAFKTYAPPQSLLPALRANSLASGRIHDADQRNIARLRCTIAAIAAERYRLQHAAWPDSLADLAGSPVPESWTDPFDGAPLRYRILEDGVIVYSIGPDGQDNGGKLSKNGMATGTDLGVRLWNPESRGQ